MQDLAKDRPLGEASGRASWGAWLTWGMACGPLTVQLLRVYESAWVAMLTYHAVTLLVGVRLASWGPRPPVPRVLLVGIASLALTVATGFAILPRLGVTRATLLRWNEWGAAPPAGLWLLLYYALVNPWIEELFWRGARVGPVPGRRPTGIPGVTVFWLFHVWVLASSFGLAVGALVSLPVWLAGFAWAWMCRRRGGIWWSGASHQGANAGLVLLYLWILQSA